MRSAGIRLLRYLAFTLLAPLIFLAAAEIVVRLAGIEPGDTSAPGGGAPAPGIRVDPLLGARPIPGWSGGWSLEGFPVIIDERGFRSTGQPPPPPGATRVAFLGDSCTFGWGLDSESTYVSAVERLARQRGRPMEVINAAYPGDSAVLGQFVFREQVLPLRPDVVVLAYSGNNAFRFSRASDAERFRHFELRKLLLRSRLVQIYDAWARRHLREEEDPRDARVVSDLPLAQRRRVATPAEFRDAMASMVRLARDAGSRVVILLFPRASQVSERFGGEDAVVAYGLFELPQRSDPEAVSHIDGHMLQYSCIDHTKLEDPVAAVRALVREWKTVYPVGAPEVQRQLRAGARAFTAGRLGAADRAFREALKIDPDSPLALYDLGATAIAAGRPGDGLRLMRRAQRLACNVFLQYQVVARQLAVELDVPVVDLVLHFQAGDAGKLFLDPAHPSPEAGELIAEALWPELVGGAAKAAR